MTQDSVCWKSSVPPGGKPRFRGSAGTRSPPLALKFSCYWPKVSAPSGNLTFHWPVLSHMTFLSRGCEAGEPATSSAED